MMKPVLILRAGYLASYAYALRKLGVDPAPLLDRHHLPTELDDLSAYMVSAQDVYRFIEDAVHFAGSGEISMEAGFHNARCQPNPFREGAGDAASLLEAIERHNEQAASYGPGARFTLRLDNQHARWSKTTRSPIAETEIFCVASLIGHVRTFAHPRWLPDAIEVGMAAPEDLARLPQLKQVPVGVSEDYGTHVTFPLSDVRRVHSARSRNVASGSNIDRSEEPNFVESIRLLMKGFARAGNLNVESTARAARLTVRTLQRRLQEAGVSHTELADQVRFEISRDLLLTAREKTVTEIGFELGYRDPGSFSRAFRRFAGLPPAEFRRQQPSANEPVSRPAEKPPAVAVPR